MKEGLRLYRTLIFLFLCAIVVLVYMNFNLVKSTQVGNISIPVANIIEKNEVRKFGYSEIFKIISKNKNFEILSIEDKIDDNNIIKMVLKFNSSAEDFYNCLESLKSEACLISIENIKIDKTQENIQNITFTSSFLKSK
jgi:hypothetical protein